jgi:hypothetical protein
MQEVPLYVPRSRMMTGPDAKSPAAARLLEKALVFTFFAHGLGMLSMALLLLPGMPGGPNADVAARGSYVAAHSWLWRLGWFPWQLTAASDLLLAIALVATPWIPRLPAVLTLLITLAALVPDQTGQAVWITRGVTLAREAVASGAFDRYAAFEARTFHWIAGLATIGYLLGALGWTWCFAAAGTWSRTLTWLSVVMWSIFALVTATLFIPASHRPSAAIVSAGNAIGFVLLMIWLIAVSDRVLARARPIAAHGRYALWRHPASGMLGRMIDLVGNSHFARAVGECLPAPALASDISDVIYVNYLVDAKRIERFVPPRLELQRLGPGKHHAMFSFLTYRHGHFAPTLLGPLRRLAPSPIQSNWRIYVTDLRTGKAGVYFLTTCISSTLHALGGRTLCEGVPMQVPRRGELARDSSGTIRMLLDPGGGSCPDVRAELSPIATQPWLPESWRECFASYREFLQYCVPQDRALSSQPWHRHVTRQEIDLGIALDSCEPLTGQVISRAADEIAGGATEPVCFRVPRVRFRFARQYFDRWV